MRSGALGLHAEIPGAADRDALASISSHAGDDASSASHPISSVPAGLTFNTRNPDQKQEKIRLNRRLLELMREKDLRSTKRGNKELLWAEIASRLRKEFASSGFNENWKSCQVTREQ